VKHVFVVDPDVDIFSDEQIDWALATRSGGPRPRGAIGFRTLPLALSLRGARTGARRVSISRCDGRCARNRIPIPNRRASRASVSLR